ncbi:hypothetical protein L3Q82_007759 [Scortum barcoo]|uniref:Uncharacterized protein n=1 Tax=Scortum barcoo TaxID=214431 RepID=A0ACB8WPN0_9TELE|nr:hypothetical protein L3Q82_007759 [Scortum barcoo]
MTPLQFAYQPQIGVEDAIIFLLYRAYTLLEEAGSTVRVMFFDFSSAFNTIRPALLNRKLLDMQVDSSTRGLDPQLPHRPAVVCEAEEHHIRQHCEQHEGTTGGQSCLPSCLHFTPQTQKFSDDSAIVGCISRNQEEECRSVVDRFVEWCGLNQLQLNVTKTELVVDFRKQRTRLNSVAIRGTEVDIVDSLQMFYHSVVSSIIFYAVVCWGSRLKTADTNRLNKLIRRAGSVLGVELEFVVKVSERRMLRKLLSITDNVSSPPACHTDVLSELFQP